MPCSARAPAVAHWARTPPPPAREPAVDTAVSVCVGLGREGGGRGGMWAQLLAPRDNGSGIVRAPAAEQALCAASLVRP